MDFEERLRDPKYVEGCQRGREEVTTSIESNSFKLEGGGFILDVSKNP